MRDNTFSYFQMKLLIKLFYFLAFNKLYDELKYKHCIVNFGKSVLILRLKFCVYKIFHIVFVWFQYFYN